MSKNSTQRENSTPRDIKKKLYLYSETAKLTKAIASDLEQAEPSMGIGGGV